MTNKSIIIFDGECIYCNSFIHAVIKNDNGYFSIVDRNTSDFKTYHDKLPNNFKKSDTVFLYDGQQFFQKSEAVRKILKHCNCPYKIVAFLLGLIPLPFRNFFYDLFAKNRHSIKKNCTLPSAAIKARFVQ